MEKLFAGASAQINAPASRIFEVLTQPRYTKQYMFGCEAVTDWTVGSPLLWTGQVEGEDVAFVKGTIVSFVPEELLEYTTIDPNGGIADIPENYLTVSCRLTPQNDGTLLEISQGDFAQVANSAQRYKDTADGWGPLLSQIKAIAEQS